MADKAKRERKDALLALQKAVDSELSDAESYIEEVTRDRVKSTEYYHRTAKELGADVGRSSAHSSDVYDTINFLLPAIMRIFFSPQDVVRFVPSDEDDAAFADQASDYTNRIVVNQDNPGFSIFWKAIKDALLQKTGVFKWWWDESVEVETVEYTGLDEIQFEALTSDPDVEVVEETVIQEATLDDSDMEVEPALRDVKAKHFKTNGRARFDAVPPEEILVARNARSFDDSSIVAHRTIRRVGELVAEGFDKELVLEYAGSDEDYAEADSEEARNPFHDRRPERTDESAREVLYVESYIKYDLDGDGVGELVKVISLGTEHKIVDVEPVSEVRVADICPDPEPHTAIGSCPADATRETQRIKTQVMRDVLDSLGESIVPRNGVVEGQVNMDDVLNKELGAPIRMRAPGMVQPYTVPFVGKEALPVLQYVDEQREARTGASKASMGLDAGALQSSTKAAVSATIQAAQGRPELIARIFAETGVKKLFKGLLRLVVENQDRERTVRLRNEWVRVDPRSWNAEMDVTVELGLSGSSPEDRMQYLAMVAEKQEQILLNLGSTNPLADLSHYRHTLAKMVELAGFKNASAFFGEITPDVLAKLRKDADQQQQDPNALIAQAEIAKAQAQTAKIQSDAELDRAKLALEDDRERDKLEADVMLRAAEIEAKHNTQVDVAMIQRLMDRKRDQGAENGSTQSGSGRGR